MKKGILTFLFGLYGFVILASWGFTMLYIGQKHLPLNRQEISLPLFIICVIGLIHVILFDKLIFKWFRKQGLDI